MRALVLALVAALCGPYALPGAQATLDPEFELIRRVAAGGPLGADPALVRAAFDEVLADAVVARIYKTPPLVADEDRVLAALATGPAERALLAKLPLVARGTNPFDAAAGGFESALAARCAVEQIEHPDDPAAAVEQRRRAELALAAARDAGTLVLLYDSLAWLGLYAAQGGDVTVARRYLSEAAAVADRTGAGAARFATRRYLALTYALESNLPSALREAELAERVVAGRELPDAVLATAGPALYSELIDYATRLGDRAKAVVYARRNADLLALLHMPVDQQATAIERLGQLYAKGASGDVGDAKRGAEALASAANLWDGAGQPDRAVLDYTAAGVLLVENASATDARALFERALALAMRTKSASMRAGVEYWVGRSYLAEAAGAEPKAARAAYDRGVTMLSTALRRVEASHNSAPELRTTLHFWLGRAYLEGPAPNARAAVDHFNGAFGAALESGDVNTAVSCAELALRALSARGDEAGARAAAVAFYDRLAASNRIDPLNAANALAAELQRDAIGVKGVAPASVALYDHVAGALSKTNPAKSAVVEATVALSAAAARDRELLAARASGAFDRLTASGERSVAQDLAEAAWGAWGALGDPAEAARWRARFERLAEVGYATARAAKRADAALRAAEGLVRAADERGDAEAKRRWLGVAVDLRRENAESLEGAGKLGLAFDAWHSLGAVYASAGEHAEARRAYDRAIGLATRIDDRQGRAEALAGRARAELDMNDPREALASAREALALASATPVEGDDSLPPAAGIVLPRPAIAALAVRSAALDALARAAAEPADRARLTDLARAADALAGELKSQGP